MTLLAGLSAELFGTALAQPGETWLQTGPGHGVQMLVGSLVVLVLLGVWVWLLRRGVVTRRPSGAITIETAVPLGDRRSLAIVAVEGRRLLIGLTPASVSLVTSLEPQPAAFDQALDQASQPVTKAP